MRLGDILAAGAFSEDPHGLLIFSLGAIGAGWYFVSLGREMLSEEPDKRGAVLRLFAISFWEKHPRLSIAGGYFWILVGLCTLVLYLLWLVGIVGPANRP